MSNFETKETTLGKLLKENNNFIIPPHQRGYTWKDEAIQFLDDIFTVVKKEEEYFIGPMVFLREKDKKDQVEVIDGQQRIITTCLLFCGLRDLLKQHNIKNEEGEVLFQKIHDTYLVKSEELLGPKKIILTPNYTDKNIIREIIKKPKNAEERQHELKEKTQNKKISSWKNIEKVYNYAIEKIKKKSEIEGLEKVANDIIRTLSRYIKLIEIDVSSEMDAYLIFETLNSRGVSLAPLDLIKNYFFKQIKNPKIIEEYNIKWSNILEEFDIKHFTNLMRYYLIYKYEFIREKDMFKFIKDKGIGENKEKAMDIIDSLHNKFSEYYKQIVKEPTTDFWKDEEVVELLQDISSLKITQHTPVIFTLLETYKDKSKIKPKIIKLYSVLLRRVVCGRSPSEFEKKLGSLCTAIKNKNMNEFVRLLKEINPSDNEVFASLSEKQFIKNKEIDLARIILRILNDGLTEKKEVKSKRNLTVEHIYPKSRSEKLGKNKHLVHYLGNLTLLTQKDNQKMGNKVEFKEKLKIYSESELKINKELSKYQEWNSRTIIQRTKELSQKFVKITKF